MLALYPPRDRFEALAARRQRPLPHGAGEDRRPLRPLRPHRRADRALRGRPGPHARRPPRSACGRQELADAVAASPSLGRTLGALRSEGGTAPRQQFVDSFAELLRALRLGEAFRPAELPVQTAVKERVAVDLPEPFDQVKTGGGGRFLIFYLKNAKKLAIFDVFQARIVHEIEVAGRRALRRRPRQAAGRLARPEDHPALRPAHLRAREDRAGPRRRHGADGPDGKRLARPAGAVVRRQPDPDGRGPHGTPGGRREQLQQIDAVGLRAGRLRRRPDVHRLEPQPVARRLSP